MRLIGSRIGHFRIDAQIGQGGMGNVYRGFDETLKRAVAIKVLRSHSRALPEARGRLIREARILSKLQHPSICQIYDLVEHDGTDLLVLELVEGETLSRARLAALSPNQKLSLAQDLTDVLVTAHRAGVIHRDLKPDNLMLSSAGELKVLDFGIARHFNGAIIPKGTEEAKVEAEVGTSAITDSGPVTELSQSEARPESSMSDWTPRKGDGGWPESHSLDDSTEVVLAAAPEDADASVEAEAPVDAEAPADAEDTVITGDFKLDPTLAHPLSLLDATSTPTRDPGVTFVTSDHSLVGTLSYMSPEQAMNREITPASDMFSFGILLLEMLTGRRAYPEDLEPMQQHRHVVEGRTSPPEGVEPDLADLIRSLIDLSPSQRPSASAVGHRLARIQAKPERRRRQRQKQAWIVAATLMLALMVGMVLRSRFQAQQAATLAGEFSLQARDVEWLMRAAALSPPQDVRPLRQEVRSRMDALGEQMQALGPAAQGPGLHALGRSALALGELEEARGHLEAAWQIGYRPSGVAADLGRALLHLYERRASALRLQVKPDERQAPMDELHRQLRSPGLSYLHQAINTPDRATGSLLRQETIGLDTAIIALHEDRWDDATSEAQRAVESQPRLYEAYVVQALTHISQGHEQLKTGEYDPFGESLRLSKDAWQRAQHIGRGDPTVYRGLCELARLELQAVVNSTGGEIQPVLDYGISACRTALLIDPDDVDASGLLATLFFRQAESSYGTEVDESYDRAVAQARRTLDMGPESIQAWNTLGNIFLARADHAHYRDGDDPTPYAKEAAAALQTALKLAPASPRLWNSLGNIASLQADFAFHHDKDPIPHIETSLEAYDKALALSPDFDFIYSNILGSHILAARHQIAHGQSPLTSITEGLQVAELGLSRNPNLSGCLSGRGLLLALKAQWLDRDPESALDAEVISLLDRAIASGLRSVEVFPGHFYTLLNLAEIWLIRAEAVHDRGENASADFSRSRQYLNEAREMDPGNKVLAQLDERFHQAAQIH